MGVEKIPQEGDTRIRLKHKIMPKGELRLKLLDINQHTI